ncbi:MAG: hypothetical protein EOO51_08420 [Flavobacterium sp.]|nr:MAG: hypothetical protein EOO51_08420 [Flavobacterium sp.]
MNDGDIVDFITAAALAGHHIQNEIEVQIWNAGGLTHIPQPLPVGQKAVYLFAHGNSFLKIGKICGQNASKRFQYHHYNGAAPSTLYGSLSKDDTYIALINGQHIGQWIKENTTRFNIYFPDHYSDHLISFAESFFILKYSPVFEG